MNALFRFILGLCLVGVAKLNATGSLKVTLSPAQALAAGALWRVDGGAGMKSGTLVSDLASGPHTVDFESAPGWIAPARISVVVTDNETTNASGIFVQSASMQITLMPPSGQWKVDERPWVPSGAVVKDLAPGNHSIRYQNVSGYQMPAMEMVNLVSGQALSWARSYGQRAQLRLMLVPSYARWRVDGGVWNDAGATVTDLTLGNHTVEYSSIPGFKTPPNETFNLGPGQALLPQRNYVQLAQITVYIDQNGWWRVDGGAWQPSGATVSNLLPGAHAISFSQVTGYNLLPDETISVSEGQTATISRSYSRRLF